MRGGDITEAPALQIRMQMIGARARLARDRAGEKPYAEAGLKAFNAGLRFTLLHVAAGAASAVAPDDSASLPFAGIHFGFQSQRRRCGAFRCVRSS